MTFILVLALNTVLALAIAHAAITLVKVVIDEQRRS